MNNDIAISVRNVSKKFRLFASPKERLIEALHPFRKQYHREFWALRDVSFDIQRGQTIGILGRNGAGKSTLLQIICSIMRPTEGTVQVEGRISSLLELGAGFNPEFTGRDNVILNGAIMGIPREEMLQRLSIIEAFADIGEFFDQPVKTYSSGMYARLAFACSINVDPDILVVDEVLSVGDAKFQNKCFMHFRDFQAKGKTIIFVSHSTEAVVKHCDRAILLERAGIVADGVPRNVVDCYLELLFTGRLDSYSVLPNLVEEGFAGYNIVHFRKEYFAIAQQLGPFELSQESQERLEEYQSSGHIHVAGSLEELRAILAHADKKTNSNPVYAPFQHVSVECGDEPEKVKAFLSESAFKDCCSERKSFNPSEYRYGDGRGQILDYLLVVNGVVEPVIVESGAKCVIYMKVRYASDIQRPMFGLAVKTVDGQTVHGTNTMMAGTILPPVTRGQTVTVKLEWEAWLNAGDYFIDLGCAEINDGESVPLDRRYGMVHIVIGTQKHFSGPANLCASVTEIYRTSP